MKLNGTADAIIEAVAQTCPEAREALLYSALLHHSRAVAPYQAAALFALARRCNFEGARVLEIGTARGYSASILAQACPLASIVTLNPEAHEAAEARRNLAAYPNVDVVEMKSWDYEVASAGNFDFVFVDGDHKHVRRDFPWWDRLNVGGTIIFHDYSPAGTYRACVPVFEALNEFAAMLGRDFDVQVVDNGGVGMAGFTKRAGDALDLAITEKLATCQLFSSAGFTYLSGLYRLAAERQGIKGALVECGCQNGGSAAALALGLGGKRAAWLFDTFTGNPMPQAEDGGWAMHKYSHQPDGWCRGSEAQVREVWERLKLRNLHVVAGHFDETLAEAAVGKVAVLHVDANLYDGTRLALERFGGDVVSGGLVIVSAYHHWAGVKQAADEYLSGRDVKLNTLEKGIWFAKP